ncbi:MAG: NAD(P)-dependent alcohol dehydrogenase [Leptolyngbyaceae cyanobacterium]
MQTVSPHPAASEVASMRAIVQTEYGSPDVLQLKEVDRPVPQAHEVLSKVQASSVHAGIWHLMRGTPFLIRLIFGGLRKPKIQILGNDVAGRVEVVGQDMTEFQPGDEVFGDLSECGFGAFAEYVCAPATALALKPKPLTFVEAAAVPTSALAALQALRDVGQLQPGQQVLVNGAAGGVGSFAIQLAKELGAEVTGVCHTNKVAMVRSLGADQVIDYTQTDITQTEQRYDLIIDTAAYRSVLDWLPTLTPQGTYVLVGGATPRFFQAMLLGPMLTQITGKSVKCLSSTVQQDDLVTLKELLEAGQLVPHLDRTYPLAEVPAAIRYLEQRQVQGKVAIQIG